MNEFEKMAQTDDGRKWKLSCDFKYGKPPTPPTHFYYSLSGQEEYGIVTAEDFAKFEKYHYSAWIPLWEDGFE